MGAEVDINSGARVFFPSIALIFVKGKNCFSRFIMWPVIKMGVSLIHEAVNSILYTLRSD